MDKNVILAKKYGRAIYEIAAEQNSLEKTEEELHLIADAIKEHADLKGSFSILCLQRMSRKIRLRNYLQIRFSLSFCSSAMS